MIYTAISTQKSVPSTLAFTQKGIVGLTVGTVSTLQIFGKPSHNQVAYSGYKDNIEAFLFATALGQKTLIGTSGYPIPSSYAISTPIPAPQVIFRLAKDPSGESLQKMLLSLKDASIEKVDIGKGRPSFTVKTPSWADLEKIVRVSDQQGPSVDSHAQSGFIPFAFRIAACIDLFLRVNTYSYKETTEKEEQEFEDDRGVATQMEQRVDGTSWFRYGFDKSKDHKKRKGNDGSVYKDMPEEPEDLTPYRSRRTMIGSSVFVAKPSPKPASTSFGRPSEVPFVNGLLFPYFPGLLNRDTKGIRDLISRLFFRNMGSSSLDPKQAYLSMKETIGTFAGTPQGIIYSHILFGIQMALDTQTQAFLLFDNKVYLGFCLLGEHFSVFAHGQWHSPMSPEDLRNDLSGILTHEDVLDRLAEKMTSVNVDISGMEIEISRNDISSPTGLANQLSQLSINGDSDESKAISELLRKLNFPKTYKKVQSQNDIIWAIEHLTTKAADPLPPDLPVFIPITGWRNIGTRDYQIIASFGPRSFSFRNQRGIELSIAKAGETDPFEKRDTNGELVHGSLIVMEKSVSEALSDWAVVKEKRLIKADYGERARGSRNIVFKGKPMLDILNVLRSAATGGQIGTGVQTSKKDGKRSADVAFGKDSLDDVF